MFVSEKKLEAKYRLVVIKTLNKKKKVSFTSTKICNTKEYLEGDKRDIKI